LFYLYLYLMYGFNWVITFNYSVEGWSWATVLFYTYFPRKA
jgi:3-methyladenine DNA glycosylase Mpg